MLLNRIGLGSDVLTDIAGDGFGGLDIQAAGLTHRAGDGRRTARAHDWVKNGHGSGLSYDKLLDVTKG